ncbi:hypothetical protein H4S01_005100, partial [Coemansia sp. RSA 2610]
ALGDIRLPAEDSGAITAQAPVQVRHSRLTLNRSGYRLRSIDCPSKALVLGFDSQIRVETSDPAENQHTDDGDSSAATVHVVAGIVQLEQYSYALVVTDSRTRGTVGGWAIYEATSVCALPLDYASGKLALQGILREQNRTSEPSPAMPRKSFSTGDVAGLATSQLASGGGALDGDEDGGFKWLSPQITRIFRQSRDSTASEPESSGIAEPESARRKTSASLERMELRVLDEIIRVLSSSGIFYSYDCDLTRSLQAKGGLAAGNENALLASVADRDYWFNWHLQRLLLDSGASEWALPLVQGCAQIAQYQIAQSDSLQVCVLSRRNCRRIGTRYERRGVDADGYAANFVETEQIMVLEASDLPLHYASFVQTRGSMPFFWKQPASGLHPAPIVTGEIADNAVACARHLNHEIERLGRQTLVNLVEHKGREAIVGSTYASLVGHCVSDEMIDARMVRYVPWDFHHETRGMRYDNLQQLVDQLRREIADMGYFWYSDGQMLTTQQGAFRINCMDCLDRTNVVQSALARYVINEQLVRMGVHAAPEQGLAAYPGLESTLNHVWANNGDYISRQYAGTSAMKGDFTRTGRRNFSGMVNDATYSLTRLWINTFRDYFSQSVLDFIMGNHKAGAVFRTLVELRSHEPSHIQQLTRVREAAIRTSVAIAVNDDERVQLACVVQSPVALDTLKTSSAADSVLILTDAAVYVCSYCDQKEKVTEFIRVGLAALVGIQYGAYITDTRTPQGLDPARNHGIVLRFSSYSAQSQSEATNGEQLHFVACKLVAEAQVVMQNTGEEAAAPELARVERLEIQAPDLLTECLCSAVLSLKLTTGDTSSQFIADAPIISAAAAKQEKTLLDKMANRLHSALWI